MELGFKLTLTTPKGITERFNHSVMSSWLTKHNLQMKFDYEIGAWNVVGSVTKKQWNELYKLVVIPIVG